MQGARTSLQCAANSEALPKKTCSVVVKKVVVIGLVVEVVDCSGQGSGRGSRSGRSCRSGSFISSGSSSLLYIS